MTRPRGQGESWQPVPATPLAWPHPVLLALLLVAAARAVSLAVFGPVTTPDTLIYLKQAQVVADALRGVSPPDGSAFKGTGFALVILAFQRVFGESWAWALVVGQSLLSMLASVLLARLFMDVGGSARAAAVLLAVHGLGLTLAVDQWVLRDSLFSGALSVILITLARHAVVRRPVPLLSVAAMGAGFGVCVLLREQLVYYAVFFLPLLLLALRRGGQGWRRGLVVLLLLAAPVAAAQAGVAAVNARVAGQAVVSTNARTVMLQALLEVAREHPALYDGDTPLDRTARAAFDDYTYAEVGQVNDALLAQGQSERQIAQAAIAKYLEAWRRYPLALAAVVAERFVDDQPKLLVAPGRALMQQLYYTTGESRFMSARKVVTSGSAVERAVAALALAAEPVSAGLYVMAVLATLLALHGLLRRRAWLPHPAVLLACMAAYAGLLFTHALVHVEPRHVAGVLWAPVLLAFLLPQALRKVFPRPPAIR